MPAVPPDPTAIRAFKDEAAFEAWLKTNHQRKSELYLRIYKKDSGKPTITYAQALDVALCWGWIDGVRKPFDEQSFLQRFTPRKPKSRWSQVNRQHVARLTEAGRMTESGQRQIDAAKADGRWDAAYASQRNMQTPPDLMAAIAAEPKALALFQTLNSQNRYALAYRTQHATTAAGREQKIRNFVAMLKRGETPHPNTTRKSAPARTAAKASARAGGSKKKAARATQR